MPTRLPRRLQLFAYDSPKATSTSANNMTTTLSSCPCRMITSISAFHHNHHHHHNQSQPLLPLPPKPPPASDRPPLLLLKGDELHVSPQGVARSCYQLHQHDTAGTTTTGWTIEERYNLTNCTKSFVVSPPPHPYQHQQPITIDIQEMDTRLAGTGGTTWEATFAMVLYFANNPHLLEGQKVIELGSGVGLGGILLSYIMAPPYCANKSNNKTSMTLTDGNEQVLEQCRANILQQQQRHYGGDLKTRQLDWNEIFHKDNNNNNKEQQRNYYNTVLACDCAYRSQDVPGLAKTLKSLLAKRNEDDHKNENDNDNNTTSSSSGNQIHLFGPYNRASYHEVIQCLENDPELQIKVEWMELQRFRLAASTSTGSEDWLDDHDQDDDNCFTATSSLQDQLKFASQSTTKFLHVIATHNIKKELSGDSRIESGQSERERSSSLSDID